MSVSVCLCLCLLSNDYSLPGSAVHGIFQARILEWVAISFSRGSPASSVLAREGAGCGSVGDVTGAWLASAPLSPSLWILFRLERGPGIALQAMADTDTDTQTQTRTRKPRSKKGKEGDTRTPQEETGLLFSLERGPGIALQAAPLWPSLWT